MKTALKPPELAEETTAEVLWWVWPVHLLVAF